MTGPCTPQDHGRFAWAKLNIYGVLLACLALMSFLDLVHPGRAELAVLVGEVPPWQAVWVALFASSGVLLLLGFARADRLAETLGLLLMTLGLVIQTIVGFTYLGWTEFTFTRIALTLIVGGCTWARISVLWSKTGLTITIPPRGDKGNH